MFSCLSTWSKTNTLLLSVLQPTLHFFFFKLKILPSVNVPSKSTQVNVSYLCMKMEFECLNLRVLVHRVSPMNFHIIYCTQTMFIKGKGGLYV